MNRHEDVGSEPSFFRVAMPVLGNRYVLLNGVNHCVPVTLILRSGIPSPRSVWAAARVGRKQEVRDVIRDDPVCSSGMERSPLLKPASTWATGIPSFAAASAPPSVEFVSPWTTTQLGRIFGQVFFDAFENGAVCCAVGRDPTCRFRWGFRNFNCRKKMASSSSE